jgi:hypothetical protein
MFHQKGDCRQGKPCKGTTGQQTEIADLETKEGQGIMQGGSGAGRRELSLKKDRIEGDAVQRADTSEKPDQVRPGETQ